MRIAILIALFSGRQLTLFAQCLPPALSIENLPATVCVDAAPVPLVGYPSGGLFLINGNAVNFFDPAQSGVGSHAVTYLLLYDPACPPVSLTQIVSVAPVLKIQGVDDTITCLNPLAHLSIIPSGAVSNYQWFGPNGFFSEQPGPDVNIPGNYFILAGNGGCFDTSSVIIRENLEAPAGSVAMGGALECVSNSLQVTASCAVANATYSWLGPAGFSSNLQNPVVVVAGQYLVNMTDPRNGCFTSLPVEVLSPSLPDLAATVTGVITCLTPEVALSASSSNSAVSYAWKSPDGTIMPSQNIQVGQPGQYIAQITDPAGCTSTDTVVVEANKIAPITSVNASASTLTCSVKDVSLSVLTNLPAGSYGSYWINSLQDTISYTNDAGSSVPGVYTNVVVDIGNGCSSIQTVGIGIDTIAPVAIAGIVQPLCLDALGQLSGAGSLTSGATQYQWVSPDQSWIETPTGETTAIEAPGTYILEVTDASNGCRSRDTLFIAPPLHFPNSLEIAVTQPTCIGNNGQIVLQNTGAGEFTYNFQNTGFGNLSSFSNLLPGNYILQVSESGGCLYDTTIYLTVPAVFTVNLDANSLAINQGEEVVIQAIFNISNTEIEEIVWNKTGQKICEDCYEITDRPVTTTLYEVFATAIDGCKAADQVIISVKRHLDFYIGNVFSPNQDGRNDQLIPKFGKSITSAKNFRIFDRWGTLVYENTHLEPADDNNGWDGKGKGRDMPPGIYLYQIELSYLDGRTELVAGDVALVR